ncbi:hypothetical protein TCON_2239 [Astathelohania contejeani]|uniref:NADH dehydrogenase subunit 4L n=1 Tax=Astathelohania contejeani TaxID=164912 RepID=A0ABQ7HWK1_9MICR|nr:hypothetical protein TCON_2239 [Thelohania contejeani]
MLQPHSNKKIAIYAFSFIIEIVLYSIILYNSSIFQSKYTYLSIIMMLFLGNLFIIEAIITNNVYQMHAYIYIVSFNIASFLLDGVQTTNLTLGLHVIFMCLLAQRLFISIYYSYTLTADVKWKYYKKLGASADLNSK